MSYEILFWIALIGIGFMIAKFVLKNVKRGLIIGLLVAGIWLLRALVPNQWHQLSEYVQASLSNLLR